MVIMLVLLKIGDSKILTCASLKLHDIHSSLHEHVSSLLFSCDNKATILTLLILLLLLLLLLLLFVHSVITYICTALCL
jgi:hypothetical protein